MSGATIKKKRKKERTPGAMKQTRAWRNPDALNPGRQTGIHDTDAFSELEEAAKRPKFWRSKRSVTRSRCLGFFSWQYVTTSSPASTMP